MVVENSKLIRKYESLYSCQYSVNKIKIINCAKLLAMFPPLFIFFSLVLIVLKDKNSKDPCLIYLIL